MGKPSNPFVPVDSVESLGRKKVARNGESIGRRLDFYLIRTTLDITPGAYGADSQNRLNAIIEVIGQRAQPIIVSVETPASETAPVDLPGAASGSHPVYSMKFALEHFGAWEGATPTLAMALNGVMDFVHASGNTDNISVARFTAL
jgi:hypothetical protein